MISIGSSGVGAPDSEQIRILKKHNPTLSLSSLIAIIANLAVDCGRRAL